jgi:hypothetical protein
MEKIKEHWINIITENIPKDSYQFLHQIDDFCFDINWKLKNDPNRPNKRSRKLRLIISEETMEDYRDANNEAQNKYDQKLKKFITDTMSNFNLDHDTPHLGTVPVETIHVPIEITY